MFAAGGGIILVESDQATVTVPGLVSGAEQLTKRGVGTLVLSNTANTYAGGTTISEGTLAVAGSGSLGSGNVTLGQNTFSGAVLRFDGGGTYSMNMRHVEEAALHTNGNDVTISGVILGNGSILNKNGAGTLTLNAANTYTGNTFVNEGTLIATNSSGPGTGYNSVEVASGAAYGGTSIVAGNLTILGTGKLIVGQPGAPGKLTVRGATSLSNTSSFEVTITGDTAGSEYSQLVIAAGGSINLNNTTFLPTLTYNPSFGDKLFIVDNQNATGGLTGTFSGYAQGATYTFTDGTEAIISYQGDLATLSISGGNDVVLHSFVPVPEPATVLGIAGLALGALAWRNRRKSGRREFAIV
jgi:autotransporter-associated beta strand protein